MRKTTMDNTNIYLSGARLVSVSDLASNIKDDKAVAIVNDNGERKAALGGQFCPESQEGAVPALYMLPVPTGSSLGDEAFKKDYGLKYAYMGGAMAYGLSSVEMVVAFAQAGCLGSLGTGGSSMSEIAEKIDEIKGAIGDKAFAVNLLFSITEQLNEVNVAKMYIEKGVPAIEASAYVSITKALVYYRASGLSMDENGTIIRAHKIIAKVSREEVAIAFMSPAEPKVIESMRKEGLITDEQAALAAYVPIADDITVEADSGGHTDNKALVSLLPAVIAIRDELQQKHKYSQRVRIGAAGGISTPQATLAAFEMGASYVVTGSVNQACTEAATSDYVKELLSQVSINDVTMCPGIDSFELGVKVQVVKKNTMLPLNAQRLYDSYTDYKSFEEIPDKLRNRIIKNYFKMPAEDVWEECIKYYTEHGPGRLEAAAANPKVKMALMFKWYVGLSVHWAIDDTPNRRMDFMIMCGPSMGAFNNWAKGTFLAKAENRSVAIIAKALMDGAAMLSLENTAKEACKAV